MGYHVIEREPGVWTEGNNFLNIGLTRHLLKDVEVKNKTCLDIAAMEGLIAILMARRGASHVVAWDRVQWPLDAGKATGQWLPTIEAQVGRGLDELSGVYDVVVASGLLYHVLDPLQALLYIRGTVRNGGLLILETAAIQGNEPVLEFNTNCHIYGPVQSADYWFPTIGLLDYLLRFAHLQVLNACYFSQTHKVMRVAVVCRATSGVAMPDTWLSAQDSMSNNIRATIDPCIDWNTVISTEPDIPYMGASGTLFTKKELALTPRSAQLALGDLL
jgi:2-polyprenyl-3-methyl-5-hydroxy-6-metoxy-1,4-benzoquinol methylase